MFGLKVNKSTIHITGLEAASTALGNEIGGVVGYYAESACSALTRGRFATTGKQVETAAEALAVAQSNSRATGRKICKNCLKAAETQIAADEAAQVEEPAAEVEAPAVEIREMVVMENVAGVAAAGTLAAIQALATAEGISTEQMVGRLLAEAIARR